MSLNFLSVTFTKNPAERLYFTFCLFGVPGIQEYIDQIATCIFRRTDVRGNVGVLFYHLHQPPHLHLTL